MRFSEGTVGRVFVIRLEDGDALPASVEEVAKERGVARGMCVLVGGIAGGGRIVVGPEDGDHSPVVPVLAALAGVHEIAGVGLVFPDEEGVPRLHMHAALGRGSETLTGCIRPGIEAWTVVEAVLLEICGTGAYRRKDKVTGFELLEPAGA